MNLYAIQAEQSSGVPDQPEIFTGAAKAQERYYAIVEEWVAESPYLTMEHLTETCDGGVIWDLAHGEDHTWLAFDEDRTLRAWTVVIPNLAVMVGIEGGIASWRGTPGVDVVTVDWDNLDDGEPDLIRGLLDEHEPDVAALADRLEVTDILESLAECRARVS